MKQDTRTALLRAGRRLFARHGFHGASVRAITTAARSNLGAITYHFGSKRRFYELVLAGCADPLAEATVAACRGEGSCRDRLGKVLRIYFQYLASDADIARLLVQELVLGRSPPDAVTVPIQRIHSALTDLVIEGQRRGEFRAGDARLLAISVVSQPVHLNLVRMAQKALTGLDFEDPAARETIVEHITAFACAGLAHESRKTGAQ